MNLDNFAFFNQQLAGMLRNGTALEPALRELARELPDKKLKVEFSAVERDLSSGRSLEDALQERDVPALYKRMLKIGARAGDLPGVLTMLADYYYSVNLLWIRLKGLILYPLILLFAAFGLSLFLGRLSQRASGEVAFLASGSNGLPPLIFYFPALFFLTLAVLGIVLVATPRFRRFLSWKTPGVREASVAKISGAAALLLKQGVPLGETLLLLADLEKESPASVVLGSWHRRIASGERSVPPDRASIGVFPPLFFWMLGNSGDDLPSGFQRAADYYRIRAEQLMDLILRTILPISILAIGALLLVEIFPLARSLSDLLRSVGGD
jgi:type II secretory pathway component PulF